MAYKRISPQPVNEGGTGASTLTGVLTGNGTSAISANAVTQYSVLVGGASNAVSNVASVGTSGQLLTSNGAGANPTFQNAPTKDFELIQTYNGSSVATIEITDLHGYQYLIIGNYIQPVTDGANLIAELSSRS